MSNKYTWEENNKRYVEFKTTFEAKGYGKCYCSCNDFMGLRTRRILRTTMKKIYKEKGHAEVGYEYRPLVRRYSLHNVLLVILLIMYSQNILSF